ncbi:pyridoxal phosphate-dependent transferase [Tirmania nivea]|nr:pyridoxal phosphate-dependent transferase [Tirmania nivea]
MKMSNCVIGSLGPRVRLSRAPHVMIKQPVRYIRSRCVVSIPLYLGSTNDSSCRRTLSTASMTSNDTCISEWEKSPAEFDFRSDTVTTPTKAQLQALQTASLGDDVYHESHTTIAFEKRMAELFGKEAGLFVMSGTMGNQLSIRVLLTQPPHAVLCDHRGHLINNEAGGLGLMTQAMTQSVVPSNEKYLTLEDIKKAAVISDDIHACPTKVISLENTLGGVIMPLEEVRRIAKWARENGMHMHLDGARIWNAVSNYETVEEQLELMKAYAKEFDTLTACFSKGIGAPVGSIIVSSQNIINRARHYRKAIGGGIRQAGVLTVMANAAIEEVFLAGKLRETHEKAKRIAEFWVKECEGKLEHEVETNIVWLNLNHAHIGDKEFEEEASKEGLKALAWGRIVVHWQISNDAVDRLLKVLCKLKKKKADMRIAAGQQYNNGVINSGYGR